MDGSRKTRDLFLSGISLTYTFAFISLFPQIPGLYGRNGIIPVSSTIQTHVKATQTRSAEVLFSHNPTLMYFLPFEPENSMELFCLIGAFLGIVSSVCKSWRKSFVYFSMYLLYLSIFKVGSSFLWFQWDTLLLEAGFLCIFVAPSLPTRSEGTGRHHKNIPWFLVKWLMFRLMFASGVVKLTSGCHTWWKLTALNYHYESQCLPTSLAWWAHQLPSTIQKLSVIGTYVIEIGVPFLFFCPIRPWRLLSGYSQIFLMVAIILTGNYNYFNFLTILLSLPMLDDENVEYVKSLVTFGIFQQDTIKKRKRRNNDSGWSYRSLFHCLAFATAMYALKNLFYYKGNLMINFTMDDLNLFLEYTIPTMVWVSILSLVFVVLQSLYRHASEPGTTNVQKMMGVGKCIFLLPFCVYIFSISMVPFFSLLPGDRTHDINPMVKQWYHSTENYQLTHSYGLFRRMTGVGGRPEVIIEGSDAPQGPWKEYEFKYKPGDPSKKPLWAAPHQPRLDWQLWFAALGAYQHNPWFVSLVHRLLMGQKEVLDLIGHNPFPLLPPKYIRATLYHYHYTSLNNTQASKHMWWSRNKERPYLPYQAGGSVELENFLEYHTLLPLGESSVKDEFPNVTLFLNYMRTLMSAFYTSSFLRMIAITIVALRVANRWMLNKI